MSSKFVFYGACLSCLSVTLLRAQELQTDFKKPIVIKSELIALMDGTKNMNFIKMLTLEKEIEKIQGDRSGNGVIVYGGVKVTLKKLVEFEASGQAHKDDLDNAVGNALTQFEGVSKDYLSEARGFKSLMLGLIQKWSVMRAREDSQLCQWGKQPAGEEFEFLKRSVTTASALHHFLMDLACFMKDLRNSCPKSMREFKEMLAEMKARKEKGDL